MAALCLACILNILNITPRDGVTMHSNSFDLVLHAIWGFLQPECYVSVNDTTMNRGSRGTEMRSASFGTTR